MDTLGSRTTVIPSFRSRRGCPSLLRATSHTVCPARARLRTCLATRVAPLGQSPSYTYRTFTPDVPPMRSRALEQWGSPTRVGVPGPDASPPQRHRAGADPLIEVAAQGNTVDVRAHVDPDPGPVHHQLIVDPHLERAIVDRRRRAVLEVEPRPVPRVVPVRRRIFETELILHPTPAARVPPVNCLRRALVAPLYLPASIQPRPHAREQQLVRRRRGAATRRREGAEVRRPLEIDLNPKLGHMGWQ